MSRKFLLREKFRMASELLKSSQDGPSEDDKVVNKILLILETSFAEISKILSRINEMSTDNLSQFSSRAISASRSFHQ